MAGEATSGVSDADGVACAVAGFDETRVCM
jgi:hypothetical protein